MYMHGQKCRFFREKIRDKFLSSKFPFTSFRSTFEATIFLAQVYPPFSIVVLEDWIININIQVGVDTTRGTVFVVLEEHHTSFKL